MTLDDLAQAAPPPSDLLGPDDPPPFTVHNPRGRAAVVLVADHAGRAIPAAFGRLGLDQGALDRHFAYDIGIAPLTRDLADRLDAPAILHNYSRLLIDPNRPLYDPTSICEIGEGVVIAGNRGLTVRDRAARAAAFFHPYHDAVDAAVRRYLDRGTAPALLSLHSFTPQYRGHVRPWHAGVLWAEDGRIPEPLIAALRRDPALCVGDNQPYSGRLRYGYTVETHAMSRGLANALIEVRQDLIGHPGGAQAWAARLADALAPILADEAVYRRRAGPC